MIKKEHPTETCINKKCGGSCMKKHDIVKEEIQGLGKMAIEVEYYICLKCGQEFQTELQQMLFMREILKKIPEDKLQIKDKAMLHSINVMIGKEAIEKIKSKKE